MTKENIQQYTYRITKANKTAMVGIIYDITLEYMDELKECQDKKQIEICVERIRNCVDELKASVNIECNICYELLSIYGYVNKILGQIQVSGRTERIEDCIKIIDSLRENWKKVCNADVSEPIMQNAESVYSGYTYGKKDINDNPVPLNNRGFLV